MSGQTKTPPLRYAGIPRDIDFVKLLGWSQVVLHRGPTDELISQATNYGIVRMALLALTLRRAADVEYVDDEAGQHKLVSAAVALNPKPEQGQVLTLSFSERDNYCRATIVYEDEKVDVWTASGHLQGILETAARDGIPVYNFDFDRETMEMTRGKVNVEVADE
jgi:hypothetical protein